MRAQIHLPLPGFDEPLATEAFFTVPAAGLWQVHVPHAPCAHPSQRRYLRAVRQDKILFQDKVVVCHDVTASIAGGLCSAYPCVHRLNAMCA